MTHDSATVLIDPAPQSSVEIKQLASGKAQVTVKTYSADPDEALRKAMELYDRAVAAYAQKDGEV